jgi:hypothetical protein
MSTAAVVMVTDPITVMVTILEEHLIWEVLNLHHTTKETILTDMKHMLLGVLVVMDLNTVIEVLEVVKES